MHHEQSLSKYGGLWRKMPLTALCYLMATLALVGFPGFSGFWSKDAILADVLIHCQSKGHWFLAIAGFSTVLLTAFYMTRQFCLTFLGKPRDQHAYDHAHESPLPMLIPLFVLGFLAIIGGGLGKWFGAANPYAFAAHVADGAHGGGHGGGLNAHTLAMILSTGLGLSGIGIGLLFYLERSSGTALLNPGWVSARLRPVYDTLVAKYYLDEAYNALFVVTTRASGRAFAWFDRTVIDSCVNVWAKIGVLWAWIAVLSDRYLVDGLGVHGIVQSVNQTGRALAAIQTGRLRQYLVLTVAGILIISLVCASLLFMIKSRVMAAGF